jgi:hypothetical protein
VHLAAQRSQHSLYATSASEWACRWAASRCRSSVWLQVRQKEEQARLVKRAAGIARDVMKFWAKARSMYNYMVQEKVDTIKRSKLDKELETFVQQSERCASTADATTHWCTVASHSLTWSALQCCAASVYSSQPHMVAPYALHAPHALHANAAQPLCTALSLCASGTRSCNSTAGWHPSGASSRTGAAMPTLEAWMPLPPQRACMAMASRHALSEPNF